MALNKNEEIKKLYNFGDRLADKVTGIAGSGPFLLLNIIWFTTWLLVNTGVLGDDLIFDEFPFGLLTTAVSLEAIILATFVLITQKRQAKLSEIRSELDYRIDLESENDIKTIIGILERLAKKEGVEVSDLLKNMKAEDKKVLAHHSSNETLLS